MEGKEGGREGGAKGAPGDKGMSFPSSAEDLYMPQLGAPEGQWNSRYSETPTAALRIVFGVCWTQFSLNELSTELTHSSSLATESRSLLAACRLQPVASAFPRSHQP